MRRPWERFPGRKKPFRIIDSARAVVMFAVPLFRSTINGAPGEKYNRLVELHYRKLRELAYDIASFLEGRGFEAYPCHDQKDVEHKRAAELAGLGRVGDHTILITQSYGCGVHLNSVVTDALWKRIEKSMRNCAITAASTSENAPPAPFNPEEGWTSDPAWITEGRF